MLFIGRFSARVSRKPAVREYALAFAFVGMALLARVAVEMVAPGIGYFVMLLPAVVLAGVLCGTRPAAAAAAVGGIVLASAFLGRSLSAWPPTTPAQMDTLLFVAACATVLWATHTLRRVAAKAAAAEARLAEVFRQVPGAAAILAAPDGRLLLRSTQSDTVLGQRERQFTRADEIAAYGGLHDDGRAFAPDDYPIVRALKQGEIVQGERLRYRRPDGTLVDLDVYAGPVRDAYGEIVASVGMAFDVSDRVAAERRLAESEARYRAAVDAGALGLWEFDIASQDFGVDAAFAAILGLPADSQTLTRADLRDMIDPADRPRADAVFAAALAQGGSYADEVRVRTATGDLRWLLTRGTVLADIGKIVGVVGDVTERREREEALAAALRARDVLMHEADHRIKNSLQMVASLLSLQLARVTDPDARHALTEAIARVKTIADAHLALQRSPDLRSIALDQMLEDLCARVGSLNPAVTLRCEAQVGRVLDAEQAIPLGLIASELLTNALRHAYPPGTPGEVRLRATMVPPHTLELVIADAGGGLPVTPLRPGLGSTVVATLAGQIGACLHSRSHPGAGTTVTLRLKLPGEDAAGEGAAGEGARSLG